jgi:hypothetical protein
MPEGWRWGFFCIHFFIFIYNAADFRELADVLPNVEILMRMVSPL